MKKKNDRKSAIADRKFRISQRLARPLLIMGISFAVLTSLIIILTQTGIATQTIKISDYKVGQSPKKTITLSFDFSYQDKNATEQRMEAERKLVSPVYTINDDISNRLETRIVEFLTKIAELKNLGTGPENALLEIQRDFPDVTMEREDFLAVYKISDISRLNSSVMEISSDLLDQGIVSVRAEDIESELNRISIHRSSEIEELEIDDVIQFENIREKVFEYSYQNLPTDMINAVDIICVSLLSENTFYDEERTEHKITRRLAEVPPVIRSLSKGQIIVEERVPVTEQNMQDLQALSEHSFNVNLSAVFASILYILLLYAFAFIYFYLFPGSRQLDNPRIYLLITLLSAFVIIAVPFGRIINLAEWLPISFILPTALFCMIIAIIINVDVGFSMSLIFSGFILLISGLDIRAFLFSLMSGMGGVISVQGAKKRIDLIKASLYLPGLHVIYSITIYLIGSDFSFTDFANGTGWAIINGFMCGILNLGLLPFIEHILNAPTPFRLMELSDLNTPLFRRMITLAPGTYGHSVSVANLAESACREIGADPLLARVGAYYHDIGKIDQPEYFIENQANGNKHDELKPNLSAAIIKSHLKIGIEKAKEIGLPKEVIEVIAEHHGNGVINYFYNEAKKTEENVSPDDFSYPGVPPSSKEAVVVMLADSVEAASRTVEKPTIAKLEKMIWKIFMTKMEDGQFDNSEISFKELRIIRDAFVHILAGHFHNRIEYPDKGEKD